MFFNKIYILVKFFFLILLNQLIVDVITDRQLIHTKVDTSVDLITESQSVNIMVDNTLNQLKLKLIQNKLDLLQKAQDLFEVQEKLANLYITLAVFTFFFIVIFILLRYHLF